MGHPVRRPHEHGSRAAHGIGQPRAVIAGREAYGLLEPGGTRKRHRLRFTGNQAIAPLRRRFDDAMLGVAQRPSDLIDALSEAAVGDDDVLPDLAHQAVALDHVTGLGRQAAQHRERLGAQGHEPSGGITQFQPARVEAEPAKPDRLVRGIAVHGVIPRTRPS